MRLVHTWSSAPWKALCSKITDVNSFAFAYTLFHEDFSPIYEPHRLERNCHETVCNQMRIN